MRNCVDMSFDSSAPEAVCAAPSSAKAPIRARPPKGQPRTGCWRQRAYVDEEVEQKGFHGNGLLMFAVFLASAVA